LIEERKVQKSKEEERQEIENEFKRREDLKKFRETQEQLTESLKQRELQQSKRERAEEAAYAAQVRWILHKNND
jgi:hypothetical protein